MARKRQRSGTSIPTVAFIRDLNTLSKLFDSKVMVYKRFNELLDQIKEGNERLPNEYKGHVLIQLYIHPKNNLR